MLKRTKSEEVSKYEGYWFGADGSIVDRRSGTVIPVYSNGTVYLRTPEGKKEYTVAHRLIAEAFVKRPEGCNFVRFKDGDARNREAKNLEWVLGVRKISDRSLEIINLKQLGHTSVEISNMMQCTPQYVNRVLKDHRKRLAIHGA